MLLKHTVLRGMTRPSANCNTLNNTLAGCGVGCTYSITEVYSASMLSILNLLSRGQRQVFSHLKTHLISPVKSQVAYEDGTQGKVTTEVSMLRWIYACNCSSDGRWCNFIKGVQAVSICSFACKVYEYEYKYLLV